MQGREGGDAQYGGADAIPTGVTRAAVLAQTRLDLSGGRVFCSAANFAAAVDLLERQACNCIGKITCLRCELLDLLRP